MTTSQLEILALESLVRSHMEIAAETMNAVYKSGFSPEKKSEIIKALLYTEGRLEEEWLKAAGPGANLAVSDDDDYYLIFAGFKSSQQHFWPTKKSSGPTETTLVLKEAVEGHLVAAKNSAESIKTFLPDVPPNIFEAIRDSIQPLLGVWRKILIEEGKVLKLSAEALAANKYFI